ncbi:hypothetical protein DFJ73DRAFT_775945 [Zopfochytrium polystomum]|nr:hypothetical protein DFJ73DRAFT_775945 [Zopfochytrium polystomum]
MATLQPPNIAADKPSSAAGSRSASPSPSPLAAKKQQLPAGLALHSVNHTIETDKILGPLPENWVQVPFPLTGSSAPGPSGSSPSSPPPPPARHFFVDHATKRTTWIDPRTALLRKHSIREVEKGELPYGWEEVYDAASGEYYFVDHVRERTVWTAPWEEETRREWEALIEQEMEAERRRRREEEELEAEEERLHGKEHAAAAKAAREEKKRLAEQTPEEINQRQELERLIAQEAKKKEEEERGLKETISELRNLNAHLQSQNGLLKNDSETRSKQLAEIRALIESERAEREALQTYILQLRQELVVASASPASSAPQQQPPPPSADDEAEMDRVLLSAETNVEALRARLRVEQEEREHLRRLRETLVREREGQLQQQQQQRESTKTTTPTAGDGAAATTTATTATATTTAATSAASSGGGGSGVSTYRAPAWVEELDMAARAKTLRLKIVNSILGTEEMVEFRDKLAMFAKASEKEGPKAPSAAAATATGGGGAGGNGAAGGRARETAFGRVKMEPAAGEEPAREF